MCPCVYKCTYKQSLSKYIYTHIYFLIKPLSVSAKGFWNAYFRLIFKLISLKILCCIC